MSFRPRRCLRRGLDLARLVPRRRDCFRVFAILIIQEIKCLGDDRISTPILCSPLNRGLAYDSHCSLYFSKCYFEDSTIFVLATVNYHFRLSRGILAQPVYGLVGVDKQYPFRQQWSRVAAAQRGDFLPRPVIGKKPWQTCWNAIECSPKASERNRASGVARHCRRKRD